MFFKRYVPALVGFIAYNLVGADLSIKESWKHAITASVSASEERDAEQGRRAWWRGVQGGCRAGSCD